MSGTIENLQHRNRAMSAALHERYNRIIELENCLSEVIEQYHHVMRPYDIKKIGKVLRGKE